MRFTRFFLRRDSKGRVIRSGNHLKRGAIRYIPSVADDHSEPLLPEFDQIGDQDADIRSSIGASGARRPPSE